MRIQLAWKQKIIFSHHLSSKGKIGRYKQYLRVFKALPERRNAQPVCFQASELATKSMTEPAAREQPYLNQAAQYTERISFARESPRVYRLPRAKYTAADDD
jgi:hypothetical protein